MGKSATQYLVEAFSILKENIIYVLILILLYGTPFLLIYNFVGESLKKIFPDLLLAWLPFIVILPSFIVLSLIYGQFIEIVTFGKKDTWKNVLSKYCLNFLLINIIIKAPIIILDILVSGKIILGTFLPIIIGIASIYIIPLALINRQIFSSIPLGIKCLLGNFRFSLPLILAKICPFIFSFILVLPKNHMLHPYFAAVFSVIYIFLYVAVEFLVFIAASSILKDKLLTSQPTIN